MVWWLIAFLLVARQLNRFAEKKHQLYSPCWAKSSTIALMRSLSVGVWKCQSNSTPLSFDKNGSIWWNGTALVHFFNQAPVLFTCKWQLLCAEIFHFWQKCIKVAFGIKQWHISWRQIFYRLVINAYSNDTNSFGSRSSTIPRSCCSRNVCVFGSLKWTTWRLEMRLPFTLHVFLQPGHLQR